MRRSCETVAEGVAQHRSMLTANMHTVVVHAARGRDVWRRIAREEGRVLVAS